MGLATFSQVQHERLLPIKGVFKVDSYLLGLILPVIPKPDPSYPFKNTPRDSDRVVRGLYPIPHIYPNG